jgi:hypothetical protein
MKKYDVGQAASLLANLGVIASIVFLGLELRTTNNQARISTTQEMHHSLTEYPLDLAGDPIALDTYLSMAIEARESGLVRILAKRIEDRGLEGRILRVAGEPGFRTWWATVDRRSLPPTIISVTDDIVEIASN